MIVLELDQHKREGKRSRKMCGESKDRRRERESQGSSAELETSGDY